MKLLLTLTLIAFVVGINGEANQPIKNIQVSDGGPVGRTIVVNEPTSDDQQSQTSALNAKREINTKEDIKKEFIPSAEISVPESDQQSDQQNGRPEVYQRIYKLPETTRMIADTFSNEDMDGTEKELFENKRPSMISQMSSLHENCKHTQTRQRRPKFLRRRGRKQIRHQMPVFTESEPTTTGSPVPESADRTDLPLPPMIMSLLSRSMPESDSFNGETNEAIHPKTIMMSIMRKEEPELSFPSFLRKEESELSLPSFLRKEEPELPFPSFLPKPDLKDTIIPRLPLMMALISKRLGSSSDLPILPAINPLMSILSKLGDRMNPKREIQMKESNESENHKNYNFNLNLNLTINNNYAQSQDKPLTSRSLFRI